MKECLFCITDNCPLDCEHCFVEKINPNLKKEEYFEILKKVKDMGVEDLVLLGGEPTSLQYFYEILEYCLNTFNNVTVETNGVNKTEFIEYLKCNVSISFEYPDKKRNDSIRKFKSGKKSVFELALRKAQVLKNPKILRFTLYQDSDVFKSLVMADMYGCNSVFFPLIPLGKGEKMNKKCPNAKKIAEALEVIKEFNLKSKYHHELAIPQTYLYNTNLYLKFARVFSNRERICQAGIRRIYVDTKGDLYPCPFVPIRIGNLLTDDITFIKEELLKFNDKMAIKKLGFPCYECFFKSICNGWCMAYHFNKEIKSQENCPANFLIKNYKGEVRQ